MPSPVTVQVTVTPYGPEESDENPAAYLLRCGEALLAEYGYNYTVTGTGDGHELIVYVPVPNAVDDKSAVRIAAPNLCVDTNGSIESLTDEQFTAKYGES